MRSLREVFLGKTPHGQQEGTNTIVEFPPTVQRERPAVLGENSFVTFIGEHQDALDGLATLIRQVGDIEEKWRNSPVIDELAGEYMDIFPEQIITSHSHVINRIPSNRVRGHKTDRERKSIMTNTIRKAIFRESITDEALTRGLRESISHFAIATRTSPGTSEAYQAWAKRLNDTARSIEEEKKPFLTEVDERNIALLTLLKSHLLKTPQHIFDFADFLGNPRYRAERERIRVFLLYIAVKEVEAGMGREDSFLVGVERQVREQTQTSPTAGIIDSFIARQFQEDPELKEWLLFGLAMANADPVIATKEGIVALLTSNLRDPATWPRSLRDEYKKFVAEKIAQAIQGTRGVLGGFYQKREQILAMPLPVFSEKEEKGEEVVFPRSVAEGDHREEREKIVWTVGKLRRLGSDTYIVQELTESELDLFLEEIVARLGRENEKMRNKKRLKKDIGAILASLKAMPDKVGTKEVLKVDIDGQEISLHGLDPRKRKNTGLSLQDPKSPELRPVYALYQESGGYVIALLDVLREGEYKRRFQ